MSGKSTKKPEAKASAKRDPAMRPEYDFRGGVRGKYAARVRDQALVVELDPDVAKVFPDAKAVNRALRAIMTAVLGSRSPKAKP